MVTGKFTVPGIVGLKVTDAGKVFPAPRVKGPAGEIENNPAIFGIEPDRTPLPLFRSVIRFVTGWPVRVTNNRVLGATRTPA